MKVLVVVDMQNDFIDGSLGTPEAKAIVPKVVEKIRNVDRDTLVLLTKDTHGPDYLETLEGKILPVEHCIEGTPGWSINNDISHAADYEPRGMRYSDKKIIKSRIIKHTFGSDRLGKLLNDLNSYKDKITEVEFVGVCTDICVISNALMARQLLPDIAISVDANCCAGSTVEKHYAALSVMESCQINVVDNDMSAGLGIYE